MTQPAPTFGQIRARVQAVRRKVPDARAVGIQIPGHYAGERLRTDGAETFRIEQCDSPLAARVALLDEEPGVTVTVLLTGLSDKELGEDVVVRLAGRKLYALDSWQIVKELFQAQTVDPRLRSHGWIAERLLELAAAGNPPPAPGGYLDAEAVWPLLLERLIGLADDRPDLAALLRWSATADDVQRFRRLPEEPRQAVGDWLASQVGPAAAAVLRCASTLDGPDALPVGLVLGVVHHPQAGGRLDRAAGRLERFLGGPTPEAGVLERWHAAATEAVRLPDGDPRARGQLLHRADEVLREVQAEEFAHLSDVLPRGFDQRLACLGDLLGQAVGERRGVSPPVLERGERRGVSPPVLERGNRRANAAPLASPDWVAALLASPLFAEQKRLGGRTVPPDDVFGKLLAALDGAGGKMTATALARRLETPLFRLRGLLAVVQRVLNVEGYAVLGRDEASDTVELDRDLLLRQFDLLAEERP